MKFKLPKNSGKSESEKDSQDSVQKTSKSGEGQPNIMVFFQSPGWRPGWFIRIVSKGKRKGKCEVLVGYKKKRIFLRIDEFWFQESYEGKLPVGAQLYAQKNIKSNKKRRKKKDGKQ